MSSGVAINRKLQRDTAVRRTNKKVKNTANKRLNMHPQQASSKRILPQKFVKGTPPQKNWYLLTLHEKRLARLESWAQSKNGEQINKSEQNNSQLSLNSIVRRLDELENENKMLRYQMQIQEKKSVSFVVEENE